MSDYKVGDTVIFDGAEVEIIESIPSENAYLVQWKDRYTGIRTKSVNAQWLLPTTEMKHKKGDHVLYHGVDVEITHVSKARRLYEIGWYPLGGGYCTTYVRDENLDENQTSQISTHVENLRATFLRAQAKEARVDALKKDKRLIDAADMERPMNAAIYQFYRAFAKLMDDRPAFWEELSK